MNNYKHKDIYQKQNDQNSKLVIPIYAMYFHKAYINSTVFQTSWKQLSVTDIPYS